MAFNMVATPEFLRIQRARAGEGLAPLTADDELTANVIAHGFVHCFGVPYPKPAVAPIVRPTIVPKI
jgi:hypothetical protein